MRRGVTGAGDRGISLIEMVVAVLVLSIGVIAGFQSLSQSRRVIGGELPRLLAHTVALNRAEELAILGASAGGLLPQTVEAGGIEWRVDVASEPTKAGFVQVTVRASAPDQPGAVYVAFVRPGPAQ